MKSSLEEKLDRIKAVENDLPVVIIVLRIEGVMVEYMSSYGRKLLGTTMEELWELGPGYVDKFFNPSDTADYIPALVNIMENGSDEDYISFFQQVRTTEGNPWSWYITVTKVFHRDELGKPTHMISSACPIDPISSVTSKVNRLLEENEMMRENIHVYSSLTKREKQVIAMLAQGLTSGEIAERLFVSTSTIEQHRKNIKNKTGLKNMPDLVRFAQAFDLV